MLGSAEIAESGVKVSSRILRRYVLRGEQVEVATRQHWAKLAEPVLTVLVGFFVVAWMSAGLERAFGDFGLYLWWVWFGLIGRLAWKVLEWRNEWFVATDKRLLLTYGLFTHKVAMMPLGKVTDLNYGRSITGRMLGYGDFTLESAGQDQALRKINWLPAPDETYRRICDIIFGPERFDSEDSLGHHEDPSQQEADQTDFNHHRPQHPEPPRRQYTSDKIAADGDGGSIEDWDEQPSDVEGDEEWVESDTTAGDEPEADAAHDDAMDHGSNDDHDHDDHGDDDGDDRSPDDSSSAEGTADRDSSDDDDWEVDRKQSAWESSEGGADDSWQTSREGAPAYQRVQPRKHVGISSDDDDITGSIQPR
ncbi:hypothetical protein BH23ACT6_BH23ACT6_25280 [soil metagenome]